MRFWQLADGRGDGEFAAWRDGLSKTDRAILDEKMRALERLGAAVGFWKGVTGYGRLNKLRIQTPTTALRPIVCKGPEDVENEITLLYGAVEENFAWKPADAPVRAEGLRRAIIAKQRRRIPYKVPKP
jgi:hypothetical protein